MTTEQSTSDAAAARPRWPARKTVASAAIAAGIVAAGGGAVYAASGSGGSASGAQGGPGGGYTKTYAIGSADVSGVTVGETVTASATTANNTVTLETVTGATMRRNQQPPGQG